jgi:hypothetical protein
MPPFPIALLQPQPQDVEARQNGGATDQVTLTITHATTTYTTIINLSPSTTSSAPTTITTSPAHVTPAAVQTAISITPTNADPPSSGVVVGAVLGSILGTLVLITAIYKCCYNNRSAIWIPPYSTSWDESDSDDDDGSSSNRIHRRGGGGEGFGRSNRHGDRVKRPSRTRTRRSRSETSRSWTTRSDRSWIRRNSRRSKMTNNDGLLGWFFMPSAKPRHTRRSEWVGGRHKTYTTDD